MWEKVKTVWSGIGKYVLILGAVSLVGILVYLGVLLFSIMNHAYQTETAILYTLSDTISVDGIAVFDAVDVPGDGDLGYLVQDGERVTGGTVLAEQYSDSDQGVLREHLDRLDRTISLLAKSQNTNGSDLSLLTSQTQTALYNLLDQMDSAAYGQLTDAEDAFLLAQNRMQVSTGQAADFGETLATLQAERDGVASQLESLPTIQAETNGYFISSSAQLPFVLDQDALNAMSPTELETKLGEEISQDTGGLAGRIVTGFSWKYYAICPLERTKDLPVGTAVSISVPGKENTPLAATVIELTEDEENNIAKIVLECRSIDASVLRLGQETAQIDLKTYTGIRIDKAALHIDKGQKGVYVRRGNIQRFCKISVLYENDNYILVPQDSGADGENEVRLYDEIIVEGTNLGNGKLI